jgi:pimeloyl-ACP methyl ester carboxylesterase
MRPRLLALTLCLAALTIGAAPAGAAERTTPEGAPVPELHWHACDDGFECATATVPRDYSRPHGATVRLAVIRHGALDQKHRIGSLFLNPGGPGGSAVDFVREAPPAAFGVLPRFDWIGFDPRGVGASEPAVDCDELAAPFEAMTPDTFDLPTLLDRGRALAKLCLNRDRDFLASLTTGNAARDMDVLRAAVGDKKLNYLGLSWGGMLGETYTSLFPGRTRAVVLDSPADGDVWLNQPFHAGEEQDVSGERSLQRFFAACTTHRESCGFAAGAESVEDAFDDLLARLDETPVDLGDGRTISGNDVRLVAFDSMYDKAAWGPLAAALAALESGDVDALRDFGDNLINAGILLEVFNTYISVERRYPHSLAPYLEQAEHEFANAPHFAPLGAYETVSHRYWPVAPRGAFYGPYRHAAGAPALVIHTTHDPATPYAWGKRVVRDLGNARLLTYKGDGHGVIPDFNPCVLGALVSYLDDLALPPKGASCKQDIPFATAARKASRADAWRVR